MTTSKIFYLNSKELGLPALTYWVSLCGFQGDEQTSVWRPWQVWPSAEDKPEEEEICRAGSEVGQVRSYLQVAISDYFIKSYFSVILELNILQ